VSVNHTSHISADAPGYDNQFGIQPAHIALRVAISGLAAARSIFESLLWATPEDQQFWPASKMLRPGSYGSKLGQDRTSYLLQSRTRPRTLRFHRLVPAAFNNPKAPSSSRWVLKPGHAPWPLSRTGLQLQFWPLPRSGFRSASLEGLASCTIRGCAPARSEIVVSSR